MVTQMAHDFQLRHKSFLLICMCSCWNPTWEQLMWSQIWEQDIGNRHDTWNENTRWWKGLNHLESLNGACSNLIQCRSPLLQQSWLGKSDCGHPHTLHQGCILPKYSSVAESLKWVDQTMDEKWDSHGGGMDCENGKTDQLTQRKK